MHFYFRLKAVLPQKLMWILLYIYEKDDNTCNSPLTNGDEKGEVQKLVEIKYFLYSNFTVDYKKNYNYYS